MPREIRVGTVNSPFVILKRDIRSGSVKIMKAKDKIEYHIYSQILPSRLIVPRPVLTAIIVCGAKHVIKNIKTGRYTEEALRNYLKETKQMKRVSQDVRFK
ncbi:hypothetical protein LCGC14_2676200 [marine sediment metagenome]|uniref:Uncharacterized protein n=1 Tax=marine sediment metagenome TaxID=412755 RepID=A0A0F8ZMN0_9ZZZZ